MRRSTTLLALLLGLILAPAAHGQAPPAPTLTLDTFFAPPSGIVGEDFSPTNIIPDVPAAVAVHGDRIYTVGRTQGGSGGQDIGIMARRADGGLDTGFSGDGKLIVPIAPTTEADAGADIAVLPDGRLRVLGTTDTTSGAMVNPDVVVLGLNPDGTPDTTFAAPDGRRVFPNPGDDTAGRIARAPDGRLAIVGGRKVASRDDLFVALLGSDGSPVTGFGTNGVKVVNQGGGSVNDRGVDVAFRPGGGVVALVAVDSPVSAALHAFTDSGAPDSSFAGGELRLDVGETQRIPGGLIEHGGRLYVSGSARVGADTDAFIARVDADGGGLQSRMFDMRGRVVGPGVAAISHATDLVVVPGDPETLVAVGGVEYTSELGSPTADWAAAAFNNLQGDLAQAGYGDLVMPAPGNFGALSAAAGSDRWLALAGRHVESSDDGFGNARLLVDAEKDCDLGIALAEPAEIVFRGTQPAALTARVTNVGTRACGGTVSVPSPYRLTAVETGAIAPGATFTASAVPIAFDGPRRAEDILRVTVSAPGDANAANDQAAAHVVFSFCDLALAPVGRAGAIPTEGRRRFTVTLRNTGTTACAVRIGAKPAYRLGPGQSASDRVAVGAPRGARPGTRVAVVLRAGAADDVNGANNAASVRPSVVGVGDSDIRRHGARGFSGTARKGSGALKAKRLRPARVHVALVRKRGRRCSWLRSARGTFATTRAAAGGGCSGRRWVRANGAARWRLRLAKSLPPGRYVLYSRATIGAGFGEARFSAADGNRVEFRVG